MKLETIKKLTEVLEEKESPLELDLLCEIYVEIKQVHQKQDEILLLLREKKMGGLN